jgi:DNA-binding CsgD family transcriptional regulator
LRLVVAPVPGDQRLPALDDLAPAALLFLHDPAQRPSPPVALLRRLYGLTPQQARLAALLADGLSPAEAAERLGIAGATATAHLKQVYRKTGVHRQAELVRLLLSLPPYSAGA